ncbi:hypothetical protein J437_LFUL006545 [Ladona fulva]|uniref:Uncharacterized protein n=1 Tax=Ladona fulva TaxID=123851 RepID=A0A8K0KHJ8_LADFU|nr:hypothetical protein J437_LFUL006545 [Ladona fulva]
MNNHGETILKYFVLILERLLSVAKLSDDVHDPLTLDLSDCRLCFDNEKVLINVFEVNGYLNDVTRAIIDVLNCEISADDRFHHLFARVVLTN